MKTIREQWEEFRGKTMPHTVGMTQLTETKRAFYAGAAAMLFGMVELGQSKLSEDEGAKKLDEYQAEIMNYCESTIYQTPGSQN